MVQMLNAAGCNVQLGDSTNRTPLHWAAATGSKDMTSLLLQAGASTSIKDDSGCTPLHYASQDFPELVPALAGSRETINIKDEEGRSALCWAVMQGSANGCRALLASGADVQGADTEVGRGGVGGVKKRERRKIMQRERCRWRSATANPDPAPCACHAPFTHVHCRDARRCTLPFTSAPLTVPKFCLSTAPTPTPLTRPARCGPARRFSLPRFSPLPPPHRLLLLPLLPLTLSLSARRPSSSAARRASWM